MIVRYSKCWWCAYIAIPTYCIVINAVIGVTVLAAMTAYALKHR